MPYTFKKGSAEHRMYRLVGYGLLIVLMLIIPFILPEFQVTRLNRAMAMAVAILGLNLVLGFSGLFALCQSAFIALGAFTCGSLIMDHGWDYWMTIPAGMLMAFLVGLLLGIPALKIKGLYLAMSTVAFAAAFPSLTKLEFFGIPERTGGANGRDITEKLNPPDWMPIFDADGTRSVPLLPACCTCALRLLGSWQPRQQPSWTSRHLDPGQRDRRRRQRR